jgi:hypothetical protein
MANGQATRIRVSGNTRIQLKQLMTEAQASTEALAAALNLLTRNKLLPPHLLGIAGYVTEALLDLDDRIDRHFENEEVDHAA